MNEELLEDIYLSLQGLLTPEAAVPGVPDLFAEGTSVTENIPKCRKPASASVPGWMWRRTKT